MIKLKKKKIILISIIGINIIIFIYQIINYNLLAINYKEEKQELAKVPNYLEKIKEIESELVIKDDIDIEDRISLLEKEKKDAEELTSLLNIDIENLTKKNKDAEEQLAKIKEERNNRVLLNTITYHQYPNYPTGCEIISLYILLKYYKVEVTPEELVKNINKGTLPYKENDTYYGSNPEKYFIGNPKQSYSYGTYNEPIKQLADKYKKNAISKTNFPAENIFNLLKENRPVIVWITMNLKKPYISATWNDIEDGSKVNWYSGEHAAVAVGYNKEEIILSDPYTGSIRYFNKDKFISVYNELGSRVVYY